MSIQAFLCAMTFKEILKELTIISLILVTNTNGCILHSPCSDPGWTCFQQHLKDHTSLNGFVGGTVNTHPCVRFDWNDLTSIPVGLFNGNITMYVTFTHNLLTTSGIPDHTFNRMTSLMKLWLNTNSLTVVKATWFHNLTALQSLFLEANDLHLIEPTAFKDLSSLNQLKLNNNDLKEINFNVFDPNNLPSNISVLTLSANPWNCTCLLCWAKLGLGSWITFGDTSAGTKCSYPTSLSNTVWNTGALPAGD